MTFIRKRFNDWIQFKSTLRDRRPVLGAILDKAQWALVILLSCLLIIRFFAQSSVVVSGSMIPTLQFSETAFRSDRLIVSKLAYRFNQPSRGDVALFYSPFGDGKQYVKRLIGLPGDTIEMRRGMVYINDELLIMTGVTIRRDYSTLEKQTIKDNHYFFLGDNRYNSLDSRYWGTVPKHDLIGQALFRYWPLNRIGWVR